MKISVRSWLLGEVIAALLWGAAVACDTPAPPPKPTQAKAPVAVSASAVTASTPPSAAVTPAENALVRVEDTSMTCMLSNRYFGQTKVPVQVDGKTYHGCCANCAARLGADAKARSAVDPVTGHVVDKATAVMARDAHNALYYFESEDSFAKYATR